MSKVPRYNSNPYNLERIQRLEKFQTQAREGIALAEQIEAERAPRKAAATDSHRQAILTRYIGATNYRGSRISAIAQAGKVILRWDDALNPAQNHAAAAVALAEKFGWNDWPGEWVGGQLHNQDYAWTWRELQS